MSQRKNTVTRFPYARGPAALMFLSCAFFALLPLSHAGKATQREWQTGTVVDYERQVVPQGSTITSNTDGNARNQNGRVRYSENTTTTSSNNDDTYQVYTIKAPRTTYLVSEKLWFPWSKPASVTVGGPVKYAIDGNKMYLLGTDSKEHKGTIVKASATQE